MHQLKFEKKYFHNCHYAACLANFFRANVNQTNSETPLKCNLLVT